MPLINDVIPSISKTITENNIKADYVDTPHKAKHDAPDLTTKVSSISSIQNKLKMYREKLFSYSSPTPNWMHDLSRYDKKIAESINRIVHESGTDQLVPTLPTKASSALAALQLLNTANSNAIPGIFGVKNSPITTSLQKNIPSCKEGPIMVCNNNVNRHIFFSAHRLDHQIATTSQKRSKRSEQKFSTLDINDDVPQLMREAFSKNKYPDDFSKHIDKLYSEAEASSEVKNAIPPDLKNTKLLLKCIDLIISSLNSYASKDRLDDTYNYSQLVLRDFWDIAYRLSRTDSVDAVDNYRKHLQQGRWAQKENKSVDTDFDINNKLIGDYLFLNYPELKIRGISGKENVAIVTQDEAKLFSLGQILDKAHVDFIDDKSISCRFQFDLTGLADGDLTEFVLSVTENENFKKFKEDALFLKIRNERQINASSMLQEHLKKWHEATPLYFQKNKAIEEMIHESFDDFSSKPEKNINIKNIVSLINLAISPPTHSILEQAKLIYAHSLLEKYCPLHFNEFDCKKIISSDYIYNYHDNSGKYNYATATLPEFLSNKIQFSKNSINLKENVIMLWPREFSQRQIDFLETKVRTVDYFSRKIQLAQQIAQLREDLSMAMPSFFERLESILFTLCKKSEINNFKLNDNFIFRYSAQSFNMEFQTGLNLVYPPQKKSFTAVEILIGRQREWESKNYNYNTKTVSDGPNGMSQKEIDEIALKINNFPTYETLKNLLEKQKNDIVLKKHYDKYVDLMLSHVNWHSTSTNQLSQTPLILIHSDNSFSQQSENMEFHRDSEFIPRFKSRSSASINLSEPILAMSLVDGKIHRFNSLSDMKLQLEENAVLKKYFRNHLPVDFGDNFNELNVIKRDFRGDPFKQVIDWQIENYDKLIKSQEETKIFEILERLSSASLIFSLPTMALDPLAAFGLNSLLSSGPKLLQAAISDTQQERNSLLQDAIVQLAVEAVSEVTSQAISQAIASSVKAIVKQPKINLKKMQILDEHNPVFEEINHDIKMSCPPSKRGIWDTFCSFSLRSESPQGIPSSPSESIHFKEPLRMIPDQTSEVLPVEIQNYMQEMLQHSDIAAIVNNPKGKCETIVPLVEKFLKSKDPHAHISYRGMLMWDDPLTAGIPAPNNHFAVIYKKNDISYVFDLTAEQFVAPEMPDFHGAWVLPEEAWVARHQLIGKKEVIKYKDFDDWLTAQNSFGPISLLYDSTQYIEGAVLLNVPGQFAYGVTHFMQG